MVIARINELSVFFFPLLLPLLPSLPPSPSLPPLPPLLPSLPPSPSLPPLPPLLPSLPPSPSLPPLPPLLPSLPPSPSPLLLPPLLPSLPPPLPLPPSPLPSGQVEELETELQKKREVIADLKGYKKDFANLRQKVGGAGGRGWWVINMTSTCTMTHLIV